MSAIGYIRVSTNEQAESGLSLSAQRRKIEAQAVLSDLTLQTVLEDAGESAKDLHRPALADLLNRIASGQVDCVIVSKLDRLTRSVKDLAGLLETLGGAKRADGGKGVDLISTAESLDTTTATGELIINILGAISQWERKVISERTIAALQEKRRRGETTGGVPPYGFEFVNGERIENQQEQTVLQEIERLKAAGASWQSVTDTLTAQGHRTRRGGPLTRQGIFRIAKKHGIT
ncbi:MAG: recombinase family protein [bacterium]|nr:recombinase family protein [bacterium]MCY3631681.1 recombinase family protein [bacterium]